MGSLQSSIVETVGQTPLVRLNHLSAGLPATIAVKCEYFNPLSSIKDRVGKALIEAAEKQGRIGPKTLIVEPTSGNMGIALAFMAAARGYHLTLTMPETMSVERRVLLLMLGAKLVLTPGAEGMPGAIKKAEEIVRENSDAWMPSQFDNPVNPEAHRKTTAHEIWEQTGGMVDVFVAAVGTGGTLTGVAEGIKARKKDFKAVAVEPVDSAVITQTLAGKPIKPGLHSIMGAGAGFIPKNLHLNVVDEVLTVTNEDAFTVARRLAKEEGILGGITSGANVWAALQLAKRPENKGKLIVTVAASCGERYLSTPLAAAAMAEASGR
jgi:cysteine synthase